jgi:hypothetical protein
METLQEEKLKFAQESGIEPCTNMGCKFAGCICGSKCACDKDKQSLGPSEVHCDECTEFKRQMSIAKSSKK